MTERPITPQEKMLAIGACVGMVGSVAYLELKSSERWSEVNKKFRPQLDLAYQIAKGKDGIMSPEEFSQFVQELGFKTTISGAGAYRIVLYEPAPAYIELGLMKDNERYAVDVAPLKNLTEYLERKQPQGK